MESLLPVSTMEGKPVPHTLVSDALSRRSIVESSPDQGDVKLSMVISLVLSHVYTDIDINLLPKQVVQYRLTYRDAQKIAQQVFRVDFHGSPHESIKHIFVICESPVHAPQDWQVVGRTKLRNAFHFPRIDDPDLIWYRRF